MLKRKLQIDATIGLEPEEIEALNAERQARKRSREAKQEMIKAKKSNGSFKKKLAERQAAAAKNGAVNAEQDQEDALLGRKPCTRYVNKQRTLVLASHGIRHRDRHFMGDIRDLLPHSKSDSKFDSKDDLFGLNEVCDMKNCNNCLFFEARKNNDLYLWMSKTPHGPSAKFLVQNVHTMAEMKLTGNCMKGSRPVLSFDGSFDKQPQLQILKQMFMQTFGSPRGHPKTKPFIDHVMSFYYLDGRIWVRNYQIVFDAGKGAKKADPTLVEIGPRFVLQPIKIFSGSFQGSTLYANTDFTTPARMRMMAKKKIPQQYAERVLNKLAHKEKLATMQDATTPLDLVFHEQPEQDQ